MSGQKRQQWPEAVQNKTVSPRIREAERTNPKINAIVSQRYEKALKEAGTSVAVTAPSTEVVATEATTDETSTAAASPTTPAVVTNESASDNNDTVTVLHTKDVHGRMVEGDRNGVIGDALLSGIVNDTRSKGTTLVFDSGDSFQGLPISSADFAALNKKENAEAPTVNPLNPVDPTVASKVLEKLNQQYLKQ